MTRFNDINGNPSASGCFESVLSIPGEDDLGFDEEQRSPVFYDEISVTDDLYARERLRLKANGSQRPDVLSHGGRDVRRRTSIDDEEDWRRTICAALR